MRVLRLRKGEGEVGGKWVVGLGVVGLGVGLWFEVQVG